MESPLSELSVRLFYSLDLECMKQMLAIIIITVITIH